MKILRAAAFMRALLFISIMFCCTVALADISRQQAQDFAVRSSEILRSGGGSNSLESFISDEGGKTGKRIGLEESFWFSETNDKPDYDLGKLSIERVFIREPDPENPMQVKMTDYNAAKCLIPPEKIAVIYLGNAKDDTRVVLVMPLVVSHGKTMLCSMEGEDVVNESMQSSKGKVSGIPIGTNLSNISGVQITKVADDDNTYGFLSLGRNGKESPAFDTNPSGCTLRQIVLHAVDQSVLVKGVSCLPSGRFKVHCQLQAGEKGTVEDKLLKAVEQAFDLDIKMADAYLWDGHQVIPPNPLPDCFEITTNPVGQSAMHGVGDYEG